MTLLLAVNMAVTHCDPRITLDTVQHNECAYMIRARSATYVVDHIKVSTLIKSTT